MKKIKCFERKFYAGVLVCLLIVVSLSSTSSLTLRFGDDPDTPDQDSHFGVMITNQSGDDYFLYGHNTTGDDLLLYANNVDSYPFINLDGNSFMKLHSTNDIYMYEGAANMFLFRLSPPLSTMFGGDATGNDLQIRANSFDSTHSYINITAGGDIDIDSYADLYFKEQGNQMFKFELSGDDSILYGGDGATEDMLIYATSGDASTYILLEGSNDMSLYSDADIKIIPDDRIILYSTSMFFSATSNRSFYVSAANLTLGNGGQDVCVINDILQLNPISSVTTTPVEGMIYYDSDNNTLCCWTGTGWQGFW